MTKKRRSRVGRPPLPDRERREHTRSCRLNRHEMLLVNRAASRAGVPVTAWMREVLLRAARRRLASR